MKYRCPCCGNLTLEEKPPGTFNICPVCYWEDDNLQFNNHEYDGGANKVSLKQAQKNYILFGAIDKKYLGVVRKPLKSEKIWR